MSARTLALTVGLSLALSPSYAVPPLAMATTAQAQGKPQEASRHPDVVCDLHETRRREAMRSRQGPVYESASPVMVMPTAPTSPPPPPPPPPPTAKSSADAIAISGSRVIAPAPTDTERYDGEEVSGVQRVADTPVSTFSVDVDTASYSNARRFLKDGDLPPSASVRTEEFLNYFRYDYPAPTDRAQPFSVAMDAARTPWNANSRLLRIGIRGYDLPREERPVANLTFLVDVSGSMSRGDKIDLVRYSLKQVAENLRPDDRVSIVVYAGRTGLVLKPTADKAAVAAALDCMRAGGSTAGAAGLELAYRTARSSFVEGGINRVILATDGDFNVGITDKDRLKDFIEQQRDSGITLTVLGYGRGNLNDAMMETLTNYGNGNYGYVDSELEADKLLRQELSSTLFTIASDVKIQVEFNPAHVAEYRLIGYENRALREEDFDNDTVDAGDIGAGHQVTALYELVLAGDQGWMPERRYATAPTTSGDPGQEAAFVKLRYKLPGEARSSLIERPITVRTLERARTPEGDFAFQAAVAAFAQKLRGDTLLGSYDHGDIEALAGDQRGASAWRREFVELVGLAKAHGGVTEGTR
ncbi:vWA domain-containing protein [Sphingomicrobium arenosum]|uniref:vWA domain-containing protein n=1 Tax=Sphingomicrobium arenosum TaxID=2233861 RepID=UPI0022410292|nr:von Willebrand factor type A domain-containing protein [Sphingomicrobium arenosum]